MQIEFWLQRWRNSQTGFHQAEINVHLQEFWGELNLPPGSLVFVPLCGKSRDMLWLAAQGYQVLGIEISPIAVRDFFTEHQLSPEVTEIDGQQIWQSGDLRVICADFFELNAGDLSGVQGIYDRASLIALPETMRRAYARHIQNLLPGLPTLLITLDYKQDEMNGPPFSVSETEVRELYGADNEISVLRDQDVLAENARFKAKGLTALREVVYLSAGGK